MQTEAAGDAFAAGFLSGYLRSRDLREAGCEGLCRPPGSCPLRKPL
ncbi:hypothetical protein ACWDLG_35530 [Nonomuraea sp. NPDC003727]